MPKTYEELKNSYRIGKFISHVTFLLILAVISILPYQEYTIPVFGIAYGLITFTYYQRVLSAIGLLLEGIKQLGVNDEDVKRVISNVKDLHLFDIGCLNNKVELVINVICLSFMLYNDWWILAICFVIFESYKLVVKLLLDKTYLFIFKNEK